MMYQKHFNFLETPFHLTPDTNFFYKAAPYQEALDTIVLSLKNNEGFIKVTGPVGAGKTLLCRELLNTIDGEFVTAYIPNPMLPAAELYRLIIHELGGKVPSDENAFNIHSSLNEQLLSLTENHKRAVLIIDEAQSMSDESLEAIRLITNLETEKNKLLQVVLFGQHELDEKLNTVRFRQLKQRIVFSCYLRPLNRDEFATYVYHRINRASEHYQTLFDRAALRKLFEASGGIPRLINILCHKTLISAFSEGRKVAGVRHVKQAIKDSINHVHEKDVTTKTYTKTRKAEYAVLFLLSALLVALLINFGWPSL